MRYYPLASGLTRTSFCVRVAAKRAACEVVLQSPRRPFQDTHNVTHCALPGEARDAMGVYRRWRRPPRAARRTLLHHGCSRAMTCWVGGAACPQRNEREDARAALARSAAGPYVCRRTALDRPVSPA